MSDPIADALASLDRGYYRAGEAADRLGVSRSGLSNWMSRGRIRPDYWTGEGRGRVVWFEKGKVDRLAAAMAEFK